MLPLWPSPPALPNDSTLRHVPVNDAADIPELLYAGQPGLCGVRMAQRVCAAYMACHAVMLNRQIAGAATNQPALQQ